VAEAARAALPGYWQAMGAERVGFSQAVLGGPRGGILKAPSTEDAIAFINDFAPEHLEILSETPFDYLGRIRHAGEILLGPATPITLANFVIGPDAVLPTGGAARYASPLSVFDFLKRTSIAHVAQPAYESLAVHARTLARYEGFDAHFNALGPVRDTLMRPAAPPPAADRPE
jgi:histidinol dehydrogenase